MDKLGESAKKGFDFLRNRANETVEVTKLSSKLKSLEERRDQCLLDLGCRVMATFDTDELTNDIFRDRVEEVRHLTAQIKEVEEQYSQTKDQLRQSFDGVLPQSSSLSIPSPDYEDLSP